MPLLLKLYEAVTYSDIAGKTVEDLAAKVQPIVGAMRVTFRIDNQGKWVTGGFYLPQGLGYFTNAFLGAFQTARLPVSALQSMSKLVASGVLADPKSTKEGMSIIEWAKHTGNDDCIKILAEQFTKRTVVIAARVNKVITDAETSGISELGNMFPQFGD